MIKKLFKPEYETKEAVKGISFQIQEGKFIGFLGPNGAGKTITLKMLSGIMNATSGKVDINGYIPYYFISFLFQYF